MAISKEYAEDIGELKAEVKNINKRMDEMEGRFNLKFDEIKDILNKMKVAEDKKAERKEKEKEDKSKRKQGLFDSIMNRIIGSIILALLLSGGSYLWGMYHEYLKYQEPPTHKVLMNKTSDIKANV